MDPVSLAVISIGASAASGAVGAMGASNQAKSMSAMSGYQAGVARNNQIIAEQNAQHALESGATAAENQSMKTAATLGEQKATQAASGLDVNSGSPLDVRKSTASLGWLDAMTILSNAGEKAAAYRAQKLNFESEEQLDLMKAKNYDTAGKYAVASSLLGSATSVSDKWLSYKTRGIF